MNEKQTDVNIRANGIRLHVVVAGDPKGPPVFLLHGFPEFWYGWRQQIPALAGAGFHLIVPDQRGYNLSDKPKGINAYKSENLVGDVLALIDYFGYEQVSLVGHDWGASVAWMAAIAFPRRIRRLVILNIPHPAVMNLFLMRSPIQMVKSWYIAFFQIPALADHLLRVRNSAALARMLTWSGKPGTFSTDDLAVYRNAWSQPGAITAMINWYRALVRFRPEPPTDHRIHPPTLVLWGKKDVALSADMAQPSVDLCDHGRLRTFEDASHWVQHDAPAEVNREIIQFLLSDELTAVRKDPVGE
jgi:pimeloyl-ACP methyl ester carboxylesterase